MIGFARIKNRWIRNGLIPIYWRILIRPFFKYIVVTVFLSIGGSFFSMALIGMGVPLIESILHGGAYSNNPINLIAGRFLSAMGMPVIDKTLVLVVAFVIGIVAVLRIAFSMAHLYRLNVIAQLIKQETRLKLLKRVSNAPFEYLTHQSRGSIIYDISQPPQSMHQIIVYLGGFLSYSLTALFLVGMMIILSPFSTLIISIISCSWLVFWRRILTPRIAKHGKKIYELNQSLSKMDVDFIDGIRLVKSDFLEPLLLAKQKKILTEELHSRKRLSILFQSLNAMNETAGVIVLVLLGGIVYFFGWIPIPFSKFAVLMVALRKMSPSLTAAGQAYMDMAKELKNVQVVDHIFTQVPQEESGSTPIKQIDAIRFEHVSFRYPGNQDAAWKLEDIHFSIGKGEVVALVGPSGAGKTTIANLLMQFYQPDQGGIFVNGRPLSEFSLEQWRQRIGYVSQDIFLFNESILQNVVLWNPSIPKEEVVQVLKEAQLYDFVEGLPEGWNTLIGDRGVRLSGGQCQRLAIARAFLKKPEVLILDEATSALDNLTEEAVYQAITRLRKNTDILVIAHRLSTIKEADHILVLENGKIIEEGNHFHLLNKPSFYARLYLNKERDSNLPGKDQEKICS